MTSFAILLTVFLLYFLPSVIALFRRHHNYNAIAVCNLLLGWTVIGWIVALIWSFTRSSAPIVVQSAPAPVAPTAAAGFCPHCGATRATGAFCPGCGAKLG